MNVFRLLTNVWARAILKPSAWLAGIHMSLNKCK